MTDRFIAPCRPFGPEIAPTQCGSDVGPRLCARCCACPLACGQRTVRDAR